MVDPFENRTSRDLRNRLSAVFMEALGDGDLIRFRDRTKALKQKAPDPAHREFAEGRIRRYEGVLKTLEDSAPRDVFHVASLLWSDRLFFECHEWLEDAWIQARGPEKKAIQALIRTAGAFVLFEAGRISPALSSAGKARDLILAFRDHIPAPFDPDHLLDRLNTILEA